MTTRRPPFVALMDKLYLLCVTIAVVSAVIMTVFIFTGVVMRYIFLVGAQFAEPLSIFFAVQLTMYGAAACLRANAHLKLTLFVDMLPPRWQVVEQHGVKLLLAILACIMVWYGISLVRTTWFQYYPEFQYVQVGLVYSAIPISGFITLLFIIESWFYPDVMALDRELEERKAQDHAEEEARRLAL